MHKPGTVFIIAEIGQNHNGDLKLAHQLIDVAADAGCDAVKFQKRTPALAVPVDQQSLPRETPWGTLTYLEYRKRLEFERDEYDAIAEHCSLRNIAWFASVWDLPSVDFLEQYNPPYYKIASAKLTDRQLLLRVCETKRPLILSTGMSTLGEIDAALQVLHHANARTRTTLLHTLSAYPCKNAVNLRVMDTLAARYGVPVGYSGHELGLQISLAAAARGASMLERHITLNRALWGTDQAASLEPHGLQTLVRDVRIIETALGDGVKVVHPDEEGPRKRLRGS
jgi:N-acetylneuraminate synthase